MHLLRPRAIALPGVPPCMQAVIPGSVMKESGRLILQLFPNEVSESLGLSFLSSTRVSVLISQIFPDRET